MATRRWSSKRMRIRSGLFCGSIYWVLLVSGLVSVPKPLSQIQRSTRWLLQGLSPRTSFGGFGLTLSEWFLDSDQGIPYFDGLFAGGSSPEFAAQLVAAEVLGVEDVTDVAVVRAVLDPLTRRLSLEFRVSTVHGQVTVAEVL